jgi:predicted secreted protein
VSDVSLGPDDAGRTVTLAAGDPLVVELPEIPGTGYTWQVDALPDGAQLVDERYDQASAGIGGQTRHVFVIAPGSGGAVRLRQGRPWEGDAGVSDSFEVTAVVQD